MVLVDTQNFEHCFDAIDHFERAGLPFLIAVNRFHGVSAHSLDDVREALAVPAGVPIVQCDARDRESTKHILVELVQHALLLAG